MNQNPIEARAFLNDVCNDRTHELLSRWDDNAAWTITLSLPFGAICYWFCRRPKPPPAIG